MALKHILNCFVVLTFTLMLVQCGPQSTSDVVQYGPQSTSEPLRCRPRDTSDDVDIQALDLPDRFPFEIKFLLCPEASLYPPGHPREGFLRQEIKDIFNNALPWSDPLSSSMELNPTRTVTQLMIDTPGQNFNYIGWFNRVRFRDDTNLLQWTYRYRYSIPFVAGELTEACVIAVHNQALAEGFDLWEYTWGRNEVLSLDWSYGSAVLSFSRTTEVSSNLADFPCESVARQQLIDHFPAEQMSALSVPGFTPDWYAASLHDTVAYGPSVIRRYRTRGTIDYVAALQYFGVSRDTRVDFDVEVLWLGDTAIVELSSSSEIRARGNPQDWNSFEHMASLRDFMYNLLVEHDLLLRECGFRMSLILEHY